MQVCVAAAEMNQMLRVLCFCLFMTMVYGQMDDSRPASFYPQRTRRSHNLVTHPYNDEIIFSMDPDLEESNRNTDFRGEEGSISSPVPINNTDQVYVETSSDVEKNPSTNEEKVDAASDPTSSSISSETPNSTKVRESSASSGLPELTPVSNTNRISAFGREIFDPTCTTVAGGLGTCTVLTSCESLFSKLQDNPGDRNVVNELRMAHCGFQGTEPKVCCPRAGLPQTIPTEPPQPLETNPATETPTTMSSVTASLPEPPECGFSNASFSRVVNGVPAKLGDFPWMALLGYRPRRSDDEPRWLCGGSLLSRRHVLTAAHCIHSLERDLYLVRLGDLDISRDDDNATPVDVPIAHVVKHEDYSPTAYTNDIGLLVLQHEVQYTPLIRPICLPAETELRARSFENYNPMVAGWGNTKFRGPAASHLQVLQLPVVSNQQCAKAYSAYKKQQIDDRVICAGYKNGGRDTCQGDSGGPLMQPIWSRQTYKTFFYQIGVVSFGIKCAEPNFPGVYTRVTYFIPWLQEKITGKTAT